MAQDLRKGGSIPLMDACSVYTHQWAAAWARLALQLARALEVAAAGKTSMLSIHSCSRCEYFGSLGGRGILSPSVCHGRRRARIVLTVVGTIAGFAVCCCCHRCRCGGWLHNSLGSWSRVRHRTRGLPGTAGPDIGQSPLKHFAACSVSALCGQ